MPRGTLRTYLSYRIVDGRAVVAWHLAKDADDAECFWFNGEEALLLWGSTFTAGDIVRCTLTRQTVGSRHVLVAVKVGTPREPAIALWPYAVGVIRVPVKDCAGRPQTLVKPLLRPIATACVQGFLDIIGGPLGLQMDFGDPAVIGVELRRA